MSLEGIRIIAAGITVCVITLFLCKQANAHGISWILRNRPPLPPPPPPWPKVPKLPSTIEETVCRKIADRAERGKAKYGVTMERTDLTLKEWLIHAQEEAMDQAIYLEKLIQLEP